MDCSTVIVSYNTFDLTREAVTSVLEAAPGLRHEVIVIDNDSPDCSAERLRSAFPKAHHPDIRIIANDANRGFAAANNQGAALADGDTVFFLNPDTVVHHDAVAILHHFLQDRLEAGAVGPRVLNPDGTVQESISSRLTLMSLVSHHLPIRDLISGRTEQSAEMPAQTSEVDIVKGCALALRREALEEVGGWDEAYFMYAEERELCYALQEAGFTNYYVPEAKITHHGGASSLDNYAEQQIIHQQSVVQFLKRHYPPHVRIVHRITGLLGFGARAVFFPVLTKLQPKHGEEYRRRGKAARTLFRWFLYDYSAPCQT